jgi:hypothetical protein
MKKSGRLSTVFGLTALAAAGLWLLDRRWNRRFISANVSSTAIKGAADTLSLGRKLTVQSIFTCKPQKAWEQVRTSGLLLHVSWPVLKYKPDRHGMPAIWDQGESARLRLYLFRMVPLGEHDIHIERVNHEHYEIQSREHGRLAQVWDHYIKIEPHGADETLYTDEVVIYAGAITSIAAWFAKFFYRYRQIRWQKLARGL